MNCRNALQIYLNIENCMTNRVSLSALKKEIFTESVKLLVCMSVQIFPLRKSDVQVSLWRVIVQRCNVCLPSVSFPDMLQRIHPNDKHILWHYKEHIEGIWNHVFPCGRNSYPVVRIDKWMGKKPQGRHRETRIREHKPK